MLRVARASMLRWRGISRVQRDAAVIITTGILAAACGSAAPEQLSGTVVEPPFEVVSERYATVRGDVVDLDTRQDNRLTIVFFGYTNCPDICSAVMATLSSALSRLAPEVRDEVEVVFVTTDPERDREDALRRYLDRFDPTFDGIRAPLAEAATLGRSVGIFVDEGEAGGRIVDPDLHGTYLVGVDQGGEAPIVWRSDTSASELASDIDQLLR